jgi:hypothetical protein
MPRWIAGLVGWGGKRRRVSGKSDAERLKKRRG